MQANNNASLCVWGYQGSLKTEQELRTDFLSILIFLTKEGWHYCFCTYTGKLCFLSILSRQEKFTANLKNGKKK